jgi:oxygen-independent coproporphyrinogen-3 oxidase
MIAPDGKYRESMSRRAPLDLVTPELLARHDRPGPRYTSYPTAIEFHAGYGEAEYRSGLEAANRRAADPISLYVHIPFCRERCSFCGCNVVITRKPHVSSLYLERLHKEVDLLAGALPDRRTLFQYHWGGGTPTYLTCDEIEALQKKVTGHFRIHPDAEVAIEVDPRVTSDEQLRLLRDLGFNRLSLGVQDFTHDVQVAVNRVQSVEESRRVVDRARELGFGSVNIDLIYGLPLQTPETFRETLRTVIAIRPDRVAVYSFAFVPWIRGNQRALIEKQLPSRETKFALFAEAIRAFLGAGYEQVGMDHFALPDDEMAKAAREGTLYRNFMGYTVHKARDFIGLGVSSIGSIEGAFAQNTKKLVRYYEAVDAGRFPIERGYTLTRDDQIRARVILELMCNFRVRTAEIDSLFGVVFGAYFAREIDELLAEGGPRDLGFVEAEDDRIDVLPLGRLFIRNICMIFDKYLREKRDGRPVFSRTI